MNRSQLRDFFSKLGEESFHADQVMRWIYHYYCDDFDSMTNIHKSLRMKLKEYAEIRTPVFYDRQLSCDGTIKWYLKVGKEAIETVYIPKDTRRSTLCISSQVGCALRCTFCATGQQGFSRNLNVSEIIGQIWNVSKIINSVKDIGIYPIRNIVIMGMGEPLFNFRNIVTAIEIMLDVCAFGFSKRRVTLSTAGVVPAINKLADKKIDISLAISLHASNDNIRNIIMPINKRWNIHALISSIRYYVSKFNASYNIHHRKITIEYVMLDDINDDIKYAHQLVRCLYNIPCKINLIPWNVIPNTVYRCSSKDKINKFAQVLIRYGLVTVVRKVRGHDISAACGQLTGSVINQKKYLFISE